MKGWLSKWQSWVVLIGLICLGVFFRYGKEIWQWAQKFFSGVEYSATIVFTDLFALIFGICLLVIAYYLGAVEPPPGSAEAGQHAAGKLWRIGRNLFATLIGALMGWAIALAYTPFGTVDAESMGSIIKTLSVFLSGYLVSKLDRFLEGTLFNNGKPTVQWVPLGLFAAGFLLSGIVVFVNRVYMNDVNQMSVLSFVAPEGDTDVVFGPDHLSVRKGRLVVNEVELDRLSVKQGDFIKLNPRNRDVEVNGRPAGKAAGPKPNAPGANPPERAPAR